MFELFLITLSVVGSPPPGSVELPAKGGPKIQYAIHDPVDCGDAPGSCTVCDIWRIVAVVAGEIGLGLQHGWCEFHCHAEDSCKECCNDTSMCKCSIRCLVVPRECASCQGKAYRACFREHCTAKD
jgi:hypothetical protein